MMPTDPSRQSTREAPARLPKPRWRRWAAIAFGLIVIGLLAAFARSELYPADLAEAEASYRRDELRTALHLTEVHLARRPFNRQAALLAARCLSRLGQPDQAEIHYRKAGHLDFEDQHIRAFGLVVNNRREPAILAYREILERRPNDVLALRRMAGVLISESRWDDALETAERLIKIPEGVVIGHTLAGVVHHNTRDSELAVFAFSRVLELDPDLKQMPLKPRSLFWTEFGNALIKVGRGNEARRYLHRALAEGDDPKVADLLGQSYYLEEAFDDAEQCWRLALQWDPDRFGTWWRIGKLELQRGRTAEAIEALLRAAALEPKASGPLYNLALAYRRLGRREESDRFMEKLKHLQAQPVKSAREGIEESLIETEEIAR
jgi:tetratricopeptide (TPR) repeat protein